MDDLFAKYKAVLQENEKLQIELQRQIAKARLLEEELNYVKSQQQTTTNNENFNAIQNLSKNKKQIIENFDEIEMLEDDNLREAKEEINMLKDEMKQKEMLFKEHLIKVNKFTLGLLGYKMDISDGQVELLSLYAFDSGDKFVFVENNGSIDMLSNDFAETYEREITEYMVNGKSVPAFLAAVTIDLWNKKTLQ
ncbi:hypothetical protein EDEG_01959 [Edhazardia aedis USNM 41457]|uniref:Spindle assembly checkpoint component MAD1 n=1 Tax=Edhazardia aedis (strain USNM 41457) TaxID=1003232 RepID=J9D8C1_EDHAE|nr:hypothetical protein EDEG_01959 [Edhazardia aedis USNM 41457]|eukprot:EJW03764.1 hypothetical protein EDEG_01959 [Edhazardia aedis USNM 41457]